MIFDELVACTEKIRRYVRYKVGYRCRAEVDDLTQEVFLRAWRYMDSFRGDCEPTTWLFAIAGNVVKAYFRWKARQDNFCQVEVDDFDSIANRNVPDPSMGAEQHERSENLFAAMNTLLLPQELQVALCIVNESDQCPHGSEISKCARCRGIRHRFKAKLRVSPLLAD